MANGNWQIHKDDPVFDETDDKLGTIDKVENGYFKMDTGLLGMGQSYYVPVSAIGDIRDGRVYLLTTKERLDSMGWEQPPTEPAGQGSESSPRAPRARTYGGPDDVIPGAAPRGHEYRESSEAAGGRRSDTANQTDQVRRHWGESDHGEDSAPEGAERGDEAAGLAPGPDAATYHGSTSDEYEVDPKGSPPRGK